MANPENTLYALYAEDKSGVEYSVQLSSQFSGAKMLLRLLQDPHKATLCFGFSQAHDILVKARIANSAVNKTCAPNRFYLKKIKMSDFIIYEEQWHRSSTAPSGVNKARWMKKYSKEQRNQFLAWKILATD